MSLFLIIFFLVYGGMHLYFFLKLKVAFSFSLSAGIPLALFLLLMTSAPVIVRLLERSSYEFTARIVAYVGFCWMGFILLFVSIAIVIDAYRLGAILISHISSWEVLPYLPSKQLSFSLPFILSLIISFYGYFEARAITTERVIIKTEKIPKNIGRFTIAQISDVHLGLMIQNKRLNKIVDVIKKEKPDIIVSTGDLVDGMKDDVNGLSVVIAAIETPYGKYAVTGNHEYYAGLDHAVDFTKKSGFLLLRGRGVTVSNILNIVGVDDRAGKNFEGWHAVDEYNLLAALPQDKFTILLKHRPEVDEKIIGLFDLQLSGHTHKGQIFPFGLLVKFSYEKIAGLYHLGKGSKLYTNRGTGTWGPPLRFLSPPEVTIIELVNE